MEILIKRLNEQAKLPTYGREAGPGIDLSAVEEVTIAAGEKSVISTGVAMAIPVGYVAWVTNLASQSLTEDILVTSRLIDSGHREEILIELHNVSQEPRVIAAGEKIAQLLVQKVHRANLIEAEDLSDTDTE